MMIKGLDKDDDGDPTWTILTWKKMTTKKIKKKYYE